MSDGWTLEELVARAAEALAAGDVRAPNGRVTELPDARVIRWYATIGLVEKPTVAGRTALYGPRHLLQLVAVKRRQAEGRTLAEIQRELTGATDETLRAVAALPPDLPAPNRFWAKRPAPKRDSVAVVHGVQVDGLVVLLPVAPTRDDLAAIHNAAQPLIGVLRHRGLLTAQGAPA